MNKDNYDKEMLRAVQSIARSLKSIDQKLGAMVGCQEWDAKEYAMTHPEFVKKISDFLRAGKEPDIDDASSHSELITGEKED